MNPSDGTADPRRIIVCADDFGANDAACLAIIDLARRGAISATSVLVDAPAAAHHVRELQSQAPGLSIGLHLDLTEFAPTDVRTSLQRWLVRGFMLRSIDQRRMRAEVRRQLLRFEALFGRAPAFADGHCHVHQIPGVREALLAELCERHGRAVAVRSTHARTFHGMKSRLIGELGGRSLRSLLEALRVHTNDDFAGAYDFTTRIDYARRMLGWLRGMVDGGLIMCHPERAVNATPAQAARAAEYGFLASPAWPAMLRRQRALLAPFAAA